MAGSGETEEGSRGDSEGPGLARAWQGRLQEGDGKEVVVVGVTSGRASAGARAGRERGRSESSQDGDGEEALEGEEAEGKGPVWDRGGGGEPPGAAVCWETPALGAQPTPKCCWIWFYSPAQSDF